MKLAVAQSHAVSGNIQANINKHVELIHFAVQKGANLLVFPELSLMGYEPNLANELALTLDDPRLDNFQKLSNTFEITICVGAPLRFNKEVQIAMFIFQPNIARTSYSKQLLHADELPYFVSGTKDILIQIDTIKIVPAICYEALQTEHVSKAIQLNADLYLVSVAKDQPGMEKLDEWFSQVTIEKKIGVLVANSIGQCEGFTSSGTSAIWQSQNNVSLKLNSESEGILVQDVEKSVITAFYL
ncbi:MAG: putative amidohydrolase [Crocinitomix sp.]|jgi:predicted amidohydrolase